MTSLEQLHLFLKFHFAPWGAAKGEIWETCSDEPYTEEVVEKVCQRILHHGLMGPDGGFTDFEIQMLRIVAEPGPPDDKQWADRITCIPEITDVKWAITNLLNDLGYKATSAALSRRA